MSQTVGDFVLSRLHEWGVRRIFGYPGDGINGLLAALGRQIADDPKRSSSSRCGTRRKRHSWRAATRKFTGEVGVCLATSGPGAIHLLNGLYDAKMDRQPVLAIVGQTSRAALGGNYQQEVDLAALLQGRRR